jgi:hypothetical protein
VRLPHRGLDHVRPLTARSMRRFESLTLECITQRLQGRQRTVLHRFAHLKKAAVVVPLLNVGGHASVLFTLRTATLSTHSGQVSFPGGMLDEGIDTDMTGAALREFQEELGMSLDSKAVLGLGKSSVCCIG